MTLTQFKDPVSHMCLAGAVVTSLSVTQELAGSSPFAVMTNIFLSMNSHFIFRKNSIAKYSSNIFRTCKHGTCM